MADSRFEPVLDNTVCVIHAFYLLKTCFLLKCDARITVTSAASEHCTAACPVLVNLPPRVESWPVTYQDVIIANGHPSQYRY